MPWVRLDDRFPSHRKVALLSDKAFRLYVSALCWSSENLTEGKISDKELPLLARIRGVKTAATELVDARLWERTAGGYTIHDYLEYNPSRSRVKADREANAARQQAYRDRRKAEREAKKETTDNADRNAPRNGVTHTDSDAGTDDSATRRRHDGDTTAKRTDPVPDEESQVSEVRNGVSNAAPSRPVHLSSPEEKTDEGQTASYARGKELPRIGDRPRIPAPCQPLVEALQAARMYVGWDLQPQEWFLIEALIQRCGIPALVVSATASWQGARTQPRHARYFMPAWRALPDATTSSEPVNLPAAVGDAVVPFGPRPAGHRPSTTDQRVQQALDLGRVMQARYGSKENQ